MLQIDLTTDGSEVNQSMALVAACLRGLRTLLPSGVKLSCFVEFPCDQRLGHGFIGEIGIDGGVDLADVVTSRAAAGFDPAALKADIGRA